MQEIKGFQRCGNVAALIFQPVQRYQNPEIVVGPV
jgi:hypothetical protein